VFEVVLFGGFIIHILYGLILQIQRVIHIRHSLASI
jgi:hypothetical protein